MSLKSTFLALKKSGTSCPNWGGRVGGNLDKIQNNSSFFFGTSSLIPRGTSTQCLKKGHQGCFRPEPGGGQQPVPAPPLQPREGPQRESQPGHGELII